MWESSSAFFENFIREHQYLRRVSIPDRCPARQIVEDRLQTSISLHHLTAKDGQALPIDLLDLRTSYVEKSLERSEDKRDVSEKLLVRENAHANEVTEESFSDLAEPSGHFLARC